MNSPIVECCGAVVKCRIHDHELAPVSLDPSEHQVLCPLARHFIQLLSTGFTQEDLRIISQKMRGHSIYRKKMFLKSV